MNLRLAILSTLMLVIPVQAKTFFLSPTGSDKNSCSASQAISKPKKSFSSAFSCMTGGDSLSLLDGIYSVAGGTGIIGSSNNGYSENSYSGSSGIPPNGSSGNLTTIQALNPGRVIVKSTNDTSHTTNLALGTANRKASHLELRGITFEGGVNVFYNTERILVKDCGFHSLTMGSSGTIDIGTNDHDKGNTYLLFEDIWVWGQERAVMSIFRADHVVVRRMVGRHDGCDANAPGSCGSNSGNAVLGVTAYNSDHISFQNVIMLDNIKGSKGFFGAGDFQTAYHNSANGSHASRAFGANEWLGVMSLNTEFLGIYMESDNNIAGNIFTPMYTLTNVAAVSASNPNYSPMDVDASNTAPNASYNLVLKGGLFYHGAGHEQDIFRVGPNLRPGAGASTLRDIVAYGVGRYGINSSAQASYVDTFGAETAFNQTTPENVYMNNPTADGSPPSLLYPIRIEPGSFLATKGSNHGALGPTIVGRYGNDGSFHSDPGFNALTPAKLWPWPNEAVIKQQMCATVTRGWCAHKETTLTNYVRAPLTSITSRR